MARKKEPDPRRAPEKIADILEPKLRETKVWTRSTGINFVCESKDEAVAVAKELRRRGWKAKPALGLNIETGKATNYVDISGPSKRQTAWSMKDEG